MSDNRHYGYSSGQIQLLPDGQVSKMRDLRLLDPVDQHDDQNNDQDQYEESFESHAYLLPCSWLASFFLRSTGGGVWPESRMNFRAHSLPAAAWA